MNGHFTFTRARFLCQDVWLHATRSVREADFFSVDIVCRRSNTTLRSHRAHCIAFLCSLFRFNRRQPTHHLHSCDLCHESVR